MKTMLFILFASIVAVQSQETLPGHLSRQRRSIKYQNPLINVKIPGSTLTETWFIQVVQASLRIDNDLNVFHQVSLEFCSYQCLLTKDCESFEYLNGTSSCYLSSTSARQHKVKRHFRRDYYQILKPSEKFISVLGASIYGFDFMFRMEKVTLEFCKEKCLSLAECTMVEYKQEHIKCDLSNVTYSTHPLSASYFGWDFYQINPIFCDLTCGRNAWCKVENSQKKCVCLPGFKKGSNGKDCNAIQRPKGKTCKCTASGDPHYRTFDGQLIHFMGTCKYTLARSLENSPLDYFEVEVKNEHRKKSKVSFTRMVDVILKGVAIRILPGRKLRINGLQVEAPVEGPSLGYKITLSNGWIHIETNFHLHVSFDGNHRVRVSVPRDLYGSQLSGICGDCNGLKDDLRTKNGTVVTNEKNKFSLIGESYRVKDDSDQPRLRCVEKDIPEIKCKERGAAKCGLIKNLKGMFGKCIEILGERHVKEFFDSCLYDYCYYLNTTDVESIACAALESFAAECEVAGIVYNWRKITNCPMKCGDNMEYKYKSSACQPTCVNPDPNQSCNRYRMEGCVCKPGFVLSGEDCIKQRDCGCIHDNNYIKLGSNITLEGCTKVAVCENDGTARGQLKIADIEGCVENSLCITREGTRQCVCNKGFAYNDNKTVCEKVPVCGIAPVDIQFVVDVSDSIREEGLYESKKFLTEFVNASLISPDRAQIGVIQFNHRTSAKFWLDSYKTQEDVMDAIQKIGPIGGGSRLGAALRYATLSAIRHHGSRKGVKKVLIAFTDGKVSDVPDVLRWSHILNQVDKVKIVVIGVGRVDNNLLEKMTAKTGKVLYASRFDTLERIIDELYQVVCK